MSDLFPLATGFVMSCPANAVGPSPVRDIRRRGNVPLVLQDDVVVELKRSDLVESWRSLCALGRKRTDDMIRIAADRIFHALEDEGSADMESLGQDMKAFFLLAVRQKGLDVKQAARFCTMTWQEGAQNQLTVSNY